MKQPSAFAVVQKSVAFKFAGVPRDREMNFLPPRLGKIQSRKIARRPVRTSMKVMSGARIHQGKLYFARNFRAPDGPIAALRLAPKRLRDSQNHSRDYQN